MTHITAASFASVPPFFMIQILYSGRKTTQIKLI